MPDRKFKVGDVVFLDGSSGMLGDVTAVEDDEYEGQNVTIQWRPCESTESDGDLWLESELAEYERQQ